MPDRTSAPPAPASELLTPVEVGRWLRLKPRQLHRYGVPCLRLGRRTVRYERAAVELWLDQQRRLDGGRSLTYR